MALGMGAFIPILKIDLLSWRISRALSSPLLVVVLPVLVVSPLYSRRLVSLSGFELIRLLERTVGWSYSCPDLRCTTSLRALSAARATFALSRRARSLVSAGALDMRGERMRPAFRFFPLLLLAVMSPVRSLTAKSGSKFLSSGMCNG